jgi:hypothetical protein
MSAIFLRVSEEADRAAAQYGDFASMHEAYGVLAEEVHELLHAVGMKQTDAQRAETIEREAIQVAATAMRMAEQARRVSR